jgi:heat shock protein HslJ
MAHEWRLDGPASTPTFAADAEVTLAFGDDGAVSGQVGCNTYRGSFEVDGDRLDISGLAQTLRACVPDTGTLERDYLAALEEVTSADVTDRDRLVLEGHGVTLELRAFDAEEALLGEWHITGIATGDAVTSPLAGTEPTVTFAADRSLAADAGCNAMRTTWSLSLQELTIEPAARTMMSCDEPRGVMEQETAVAAALEATTHVDVSDTTLVLTDGTGAMQLVATRA